MIMYFDETPNPALQRTRPSRSRCNSLPRAGSLSLGRQAATLPIAVF
jgi:hypothetical protein